MTSYDGEMGLLSNYLITFITLTHLCAFQSNSLVLSGEIKTNPRFSCGHCNNAHSDYKGAKSSIICESCNAWYHSVCANIDTSLYVLERSSCPWELV